MNSTQPWIPEAVQQTKNVVYYVDAGLRFRWGNSVFDRFAAENGSEGLGEALEGKVITDTFQGIQKSRWEAIYTQLLSGRIPVHREQFSCPSPRVRRQLFMQIEPVARGGELWLRHETISIMEDFRDTAGTVPVRKEEGQEGGVEFAGFVRALKKESGDAWWVRPLANGRTALLVADAMGSGPAAASAVQCLLEILGGLPLGDLHKAVIAANREYMKRMGGIPGETPFVTGILMLSDVPAARLEAVCFGHHGLIFAPAGLVEINGGLPVGVLEDNDDWPVTTLDLHPLGLRGLAYTDGVVEQFDASGNMYGTENLEHDFRLTSSLPISQSLSALFVSLDEWRKDAIIKDDQTLLGFQLTEHA